MKIMPSKLNVSWILYEFHLVGSLECPNNYTWKLRSQICWTTPEFVQEKSESCCLIVEELVMKEGKRCLVMLVCCLQGIWWADVKMYWWRFTVKAFISLARGSLRRLDIDPRFWRIILKFHRNPCTP